MFSHIFCTGLAQQVNCGLELWAFLLQFELCIGYTQLMNLHNNVFAHGTVTN